MIEEDGWYLVVIKGSHRQYKHPEKLGRITIAGHPGDDLAPGTLHSIYKTGLKWKGEKLHRFLIVIEKAENNYSAYSPDLPGCVATGATREDAEKVMHEAIELHVHGLVEDGMPVPRSHSSASYVAVQE